MKNRNLLLSLGIVLFVLAALSIIFVNGKLLSAKANSTLELTGSTYTTVTFDELLNNPAKYENMTIGVSGLVSNVDNSKGIFYLACESDACLAIPALYKKEMPIVGNKVLAIGKIVKVQDKGYSFSVEEIKS